MTEIPNNNNERQVNWFQFFYIGFVVAGIYYVLIVKDYNSAVINMGIALAFDPFDQKLSWNKRPIWQRVWLVVHLGFVLTGFVAMLILKSIG